MIFLCYEFNVSLERLLNIDEFQTILSILLKPAFPEHWL